MAWMNQDKKAKLAPGIKAVLKKYKVKGTLAVRNHSTLVVNIKEGAIDFIGNYNEVRRDRNPSGNDAEGYLQPNPYWFQEHFTGKAHKFLSELFAAMNAGNHDRSDVMTDYFDVGWYVDVNIGEWNKPYQLVV